MLFWTIVFITYYLFLIFKKDGFTSFISKTGEFQIKLANAKTEIEKKNIFEEQAKQCLPYLLIIPFIFAEYIYLINAIKIDIYKFPSIIMLFYIIITMVLSNRNKNKVDFDLTTEEGQTQFRKQIYKGRTFKGYLFNIIYLGYFAYMFWILVF
jgi:hypothetical protein